MEKSWVLAFLLLQVLPTEGDFGVGAGIGVGIGNGDGGGGGGGASVWIGGGIDGQTHLDDPLKVLRTWVGSNVCAYRGVFCADPEEDGSGQTGPVVAGIDLNRANLQGTLVKELSVLTDMSLLHLSGNRFTGTVPESFRYLLSLKELDLSNNHFSGPFPTVTLLMPNLIYLDIRFNNFAGPIPDDLFNKELDAIIINNNQFDGELPPNLGNSPASVINLANNKFSGNIPTSFAYMNPKLKEILFLNNQLTGCIPEGVGMWDGMEVLDLSHNSLMGHLPNSISCLEEIEVLNLAHNKLSGMLQAVLQECGFDFSVNCIPGRDMQRPQPDCSVIPGGGLNCLRIPSARPLICGLVGSPETDPSPSSP
ncbi:Leucine-rich repeat extensin-like protein 4 [Vitis vinifera]|uniref:Leucine-rich repeat extensin-like protein 4 n=1 Tax=Vitis vinifera TaxID=29760 RepID=A0A438DS44_VITVI|nr:Leucine-rich repeat extensin-like protein 4 [Vitis vinifera]